MKPMIEKLKLRWRQRACRPASRELGMTLLEIMIVLALIGLVMGSIGFGLTAYFKKGQIRAAKLAATTIANAAQQYMMENNSNCPTSIDDLVTNRNLARKPKDPWGRDYALKCPGTSDPDGVDVTSTGPDRQEGSADDIKSWEP
jgi:general secretion pathway protein G